MTGHRWLNPALAAVVIALLLGSLLTGPAGVGLVEGLNALLFGSSAEREATVLIMREIRLPRALLGLLIGAALGLSGAALQGYLRNPLAEPGLIGVSAGGTLGAVLAIHTGLAGLTVLALPLSGLLGAFLAVAVVMGLTGLRGGPLTLILAGVAVTSVCGALTALALSLSRNPYATTEILFWMLGSLADRSLLHAGLAALLILPGLAVLLGTGRALEALTLGEEAAASLGIDLERVRRVIVLGTAFAVGAATSVAGTIGFVGLVVPHLIRPLVGHRPGRLLLPSLLGGAALVLAADIVVRLFGDSGELKLGVLTSIIGAPFFLYLVLKARKELVT
ncbi:MAG: iron ABC transporter permease [Hyphomicrobiaceae bacterium]